MVFLYYYSRIYYLFVILPLIKENTGYHNHQNTNSQRPAAQHVGRVMNTEIDPAEADEEDKAGKQNGNQIGCFSVFYFLTAKKNDHTIENQNRKGMSARKAVAPLIDQMERQVWAGSMKGNLERLLDQRGKNRSR